VVTKLDRFFLKSLFCGAFCVFAGSGKRVPLSTPDARDPPGNQGASLACRRSRNFCFSCLYAARSAFTQSVIPSFRLQPDPLGAVVVLLGHGRHPFPFVDAIVDHLVSEYRGGRSAKAPVSRNVVMVVLHSCGVQARCRRARKGWAAASQAAYEGSIPFARSTPSKPL
jgi:hypothetical protein